MRGLSAALIGAGLVLTCTTSVLVVRIWRVRHSFEMAARNPVLLISVGVQLLFVALAILLHWILLLEGRGGSPCYATFWASYSWYACGVPWYFFRAVRVVVVYHPLYRYKYAGLVKWRNLRKMMALATSSILVAAVTFFAVSARHDRNDYGCTFFDETAVQAVILTTVTPVFGFLVYKLSQVNDAFKIRREMLSMFTGFCGAMAPHTTIHALYKTGAVAESQALHIISEMLILVFLLNAIFWMLLVSVAMYDGWCGLQTSWEIRVIPTEKLTGAVSSMASNSTNDGVLGYARDDGPVAAMFEHYCTRNLCAESWDFVVAVCKYEAVLGLEEQFVAFVDITELYLQSTSPQEVNISCQMQAKIASLKDKDIFSGLDEDTRRDILQECLKEVVRMLEQNLLTKFKQTPEMVKRREKMKLRNLLIEQANSAAAEGDETMRKQLLHQLFSEDVIDETDP